MKWKNLFVLSLVASGLVACSSYEDVYEDQTVAQFDFDTYGDEAFYQQPGFDEDDVSFRSDEQTYVNAAGSRYCPPQKRCPDAGLLPPQPCAQPMPSYYANVSPDTQAEGIVLIHPYTRTKIICFDKPNQSAVDCADNFKANGYVLVTDIPQLPARYDALKEGTYPSRRWRDNGEVVPRW